jgi:hypothetical protein
LPRQLLTIPNTGHRRCRRPELPRNVSSMTAAAVFSRQTQTILV